MSAKPIPILPGTAQHTRLPRACCLWAVQFILLVICLLFMVTACTHPVRRMVFQEHKIEHVPQFPGHISGLKRFWMATEQGNVEGWILRDMDRANQYPGPAVIIAHGSRELNDHCLDRAVFYRDLGFTVLMGEYRGYGRSAGKPSRKRIRADAIRFYDKLAALPSVDPQQILFHGRSLGGAVLADLAQYRRPAAIILESTFHSIKAMAHGAPDFLLSDNYDTGVALGAYDGPVLLIHGSQDEVVPIQHAYDLEAKISHAVLITGAFGHNPAYGPGFDYWGNLLRFIAQNKIDPPPLLED